ncbi:hypothetical protein [Streptomyces sp. NPDC002209]|uniref:hypothetical protein n=1 Tax=Streptomyces sp. NPDC002209 TaxID=3364638 RepID=UPI0036CFDA08
MTTMALDEAELVIGEALLADDFGSKEPSENEKRAVARRWFDSNLPKLRNLICGSAAVRAAALGPGKKDRNALIAALVDVLGTSMGLVVPVTALSIMIMHYGLDRLCPKFADAGEG